MSFSLNDIKKKFNDLKLKHNCSNPDCKIEINKIRGDSFMNGEFNWSGNSEPCKKLNEWISLGDFITVLMSIENRDDKIKKLLDAIQSRIKELSMTANALFPPAPKVH